MDELEFSIGIRFTNEFNSFLLNIPKFLDNRVNRCNKLSCI